MKFELVQAQSLGLSVDASHPTALIGPQGFGGRRIYIDGGCKASQVPGPCIHLSGFTDEECEALGARPNPKDEYSARVRGFLPLTPENLSAAAACLRDATTPPQVPTRSGAKGVDMAALFAATASLSHS